MRSIAELRVLEGSSVFVIALQLRCADVSLDLMISLFAEAIDDNDVLRPLQRAVPGPILDYLLGQSWPDAWQSNQRFGTGSIQIDARRTSILAAWVGPILDCNTGVLWRSSSIPINFRRLAAAR